MKDKLMMALGLTCLLAICACADDSSVAIIGSFDAEAVREQATALAMEKYKEVRVGETVTIRSKIGRVYSGEFKGLVNNAVLVGGGKIFWIDLPEDIKHCFDEGIRKSARQKFINDYIEVERRKHETTAVPSAGTVYPDITTIDGKTYSGITSISKKPSGLEIQYASGIIFLRFDNLPEDIKEKYGFDEDAANEYEANMATARVKAEIARRERQKQDQEKAEAWTLKQKEEAVEKAIAKQKALEKQRDNVKGHIANLNHEIGKYQAVIDKNIDKIDNIIGKTTTTRADYFDPQGFYIGTVEENITLSATQISLIKELNKENKKLNREARKIYDVLQRWEIQLKTTIDDLNKQLKKVNALTGELAEYKKNQR